VIGGGSKKCFTSLLCPFPWFFVFADWWKIKRSKTNWRKYISFGGSSSLAEHCLAKAMGEGSIPFFRLLSIV